jgi:hypothetical protein
MGLDNNSEYSNIGSNIGNSKTYNQSSNCGSRSTVSRKDDLKNELFMQKPGEESIKLIIHEDNSQQGQEYFNENHHSETRNNSHKQESSLQFTKPNHLQETLNRNFYQKSATNQESTNHPLITAKEIHCLEPLQNSNKPSQSQESHAQNQLKNPAKLNHYQEPHGKSLFEGTPRASQPFEEKGVQCDLRPETAATKFGEDRGQEYKKILQRMETFNRKSIKVVSSMVLCKYVKGCCLLNILKKS